MRYPASIVIPVRDDILLERALSSITFGCEVLVSLNDASEEVKMICDAWKRQKLPFTLRIIETARIGMSVALNNGVNKASEGLIIVLDSDCILCEKSVSAYCRKLMESKFVRGKTLVIDRPGFWYKQTKFGVESVNFEMERNPKLFGPSIAFHKEVFLSLGGYNEDVLYGCDHAFAHKLEREGFAAVYCQEAVIWHTPISYAVDKSSHIGYGKGNRVNDLHNGNQDGLCFIYSKVKPKTLAKKYVDRGIGGVVRSIMQFIWMYRGYRA